MLAMRLGRVLAVAMPLSLSLAALPARGEGLPCRVDDRLSESAASLLLRGEPLVGSSLLRAARAHGYDGVSVHARVALSDEAVGAWLDGLSEGAPERLDCGEARDDRQRLVLASLRAGRLVQEGRRVRGELAQGFHAPRLVIESAAGELSEMALSSAQLAAGFSLPEQAEPRRIQLLAEGRDGPRPVAELSYGREQREPAPALGPKTRPHEELLALVKSHRRGARVGALRDNRLLTQSAQRHAARICELGKLAHRVEGEDPELRLRREHVVARGVGEALARAESVDAAWRALLESPAHRMAVSRRDFTDVGLGQSSDAKGQVCLVVLLASWPRRLP